MTDPAAEADLKRLTRLPENRRCANCDIDNQFGHGNVCMPFRTFVCSDCKSAHQAYSHRVKSVSQSNWTQSEVDSLKGKNGGGNDAARRTWLALCPLEDISRPRKGDHPDKYKAFVTAAYENKRWFSHEGSSGLGPSRPAPAPAPVASAPGTPAAAAGGAAAAPPAVDFTAANAKGRWGPQAGQAAAATPKAPTPVAPAPAPAPAAAAAEEFDLLGFSSGGGAGGAGARAVAAPAPAVPTVTGFDLFPAPAPASAALPASAASGLADLFSFAPAPVAAPASASGLTATGFSFAPPPISVPSSAPAAGQLQQQQPMPLAQGGLLARQNTGYGDWSAPSPSPPAMGMGMGAGGASGLAIGIQSTGPPSGSTTPSLSSPAWPVSLTTPSLQGIGLHLGSPTGTPMAALPGAAGLGSTGPMAASGGVHAIADAFGGLSLGTGGGAAAGVGMGSMAGYGPMGPGYSMQQQQQALALQQQQQIYMMQQQQQQRMLMAQQQQQASMMRGLGASGGMGGGPPIMGMTAPPPPGAPQMGGGFAGGGMRADPFFGL